MSGWLGSLPRLSLAELEERKRRVQRVKSLLLPFHPGGFYWEPFIPPPVPTVLELSDLPSYLRSQVSSD